MTVISMYTQYIFGEKIVVIFAFENQRERPLLNLFDNGYIHLQLERHFSEDYILMLTVRTLLEFRIVLKLILLYANTHTCTYC